MVKFVHTSDWQLGMRRHFLLPEAQGQFTGDRVNTIRKIGETARRAAAEFMVVAGDVFETNWLSQKDIAQALDAMREIGLPVYLLPGNHDVLNSSSIYDSAAFKNNQPENVVVLRENHYQVANGVEILAAPWTSKHPDGDPVSGPLGELFSTLPADGTVRIVVGHGMLDELNPDAMALDSIDRSRLDDALARGVIHYVALGDRHIRWPTDDSGTIHYSGAHEVTDYKEITKGSAVTVPGAVLIVEVDENNLDVHHVAVGQWRFMQKAYVLTAQEDVDALDRELSAVENANRTILKLTLTGVLSTSQKSRLETILSRHEDRFGALEYWQRHTNLKVLPDENDFADIPADGYLKKTVDELSGRAEDAVASEALMLLHQIMSEEK